jgi:methylthioxylose transferase
MLRTFAERIPGLRPESWTTHVAGHPPGALLVFVGLDRIGLPGGVPAALLCVLVGSSASVAVAVALRALGTEATARAALPFGVLLPGAIWIGVSADGLFAGVLAWGVALLALGAARPRLDLAAVVASMAGGLLLGATLFLSYGLVLAGLLPVAVAVAARRFVPLLVAGAGVAAVVTAFAAAGFWWLDGYQQVVIRYYQPGEYGLVRPYSYWVWADLACLAVALGPAGVAGLRRMFVGRMFVGRMFVGRMLSGPVVLLCGAAVLAVLVADLSGLSKAEVERIWLPFTVWLVAAAGLLPPRQARWWLAAQAVVALIVNHLLLTTW